VQENDKKKRNRKGVAEVCTKKKEKRGQAVAGDVVYEMGLDKNGGGEKKKSKSAGSPPSHLNAYE